MSDPDPEDDPLHLYTPETNGFDVLETLKSLQARLRGSQSLSVIDEEVTDPRLREAIDYLHSDNEYLLAAELGNVEKLKMMLSTYMNIQQQDQMGRNALHLVISSENYEAVELLLNAGVDPNVKDQIGMTPLSLCLWRHPSIQIVDLLFSHGAILLSRTSVMDSGLFLQYVMLCKPTFEEELILRRLVEHGALINDPEAPAGRQALHLAAMSNNCELIDILISLGADVFATTIKNETPKDYARKFQCKDAYYLLSEWEETFNESDSTGSEDSN